MVVAFTVTVCAAVAPAALEPLAGLIESHEQSVPASGETAAFHCSVPVPTLSTPKVCAGSGPPPVTPTKLRLTGETNSAGPDCFNTSTVGTETGEPPLLFIATVPL